MRKDLVDYKMDAREWEKAIDDFVIGKNAQRDKTILKLNLIYGYSGVDGDFASHKSAAICWRYQKAKGITKKRAAPVKRCCPFIFPLQRKKKKIFITFSKFLINSC